MIPSNRDTLLNATDHKPKGMQRVSYETNNRFSNTELKTMHRYITFQRFFVRYAIVFSPSHVFKETVLRSDSRVVQSVRENQTVAN